MKTCSNCGMQYEDKNESCPGCGAQKKGVKSAGKEEWIVLTTVANDIEYGMVAGLLEMANIPSVRKVKGVDGFLQVVLGMPLGGIDILVPQDKFDEAFQLLNAQVEEEGSEEAFQEGDFQEGDFTEEDFQDDEEGGES